jgi:hypothetical protein
MDEAIVELREQLETLLAEFGHIKERLQEFDSGVAAVTLRPELTRLHRHLDTVSQIMMIVVNHLPSPNRPRDQC